MPVGESMPLLLIGTFNKVAEYSRGIFLDLHHRFRSTLREADRLVVCGYSFGDKGINTAVIEWYYAKRGRRFPDHSPRTHVSSFRPRALPYEGKWHRRVEGQ